MYTSLILTDQTQTKRRNPPMRSWSILTRPLNLHSRSIVAACLPATAGVHIERACEIGHVGATAVADASSSFAFAPFRPALIQTCLLSDPDIQGARTPWQVLDQRRCAPSVSDDDDVSERILQLDWQGWGSRQRIFELSVPTAFALAGRRNEPTMPYDDIVAADSPVRPSKARTYTSLLSPYRFGRDGSVVSSLANTPARVRRSQETEEQGLELSPTKIKNSRKSQPQLTIP